jgi:molecular chaperone DnaJ
MATDLYLVMGVDANAAPEQITAAYQHWAEESNPEHDSPATDSLRELQYAFSVLGHPGRRRAYEEQVAQHKVAEAAPVGREGPGREAQRFEQGAVGGQPIEVSLREPLGECHPSFHELFDRLWSNFSLLTRPKAEHLESLTVEIVLTREEARAGGQARIMIPARALCPACLGHGAVGLYQCWRCQGHGSITADYPLEVTYPAGVLNEYVVRVPLSRFGIENFYLTARFRVSGEVD